MTGHDPYLTGKDPFLGGARPGTMVSAAPTPAQDAARIERAVQSAQHAINYGAELLEGVLASIERANPGDGDIVRARLGIGGAS